MSRSEPLARPSPLRFSHPSCPKCREAMRLARVVPSAPKVDLRTFECRQCGTDESILIEYD